MAHVTWDLNLFFVTNLLFELFEVAEQSKLLIFKRGKNNKSWMELGLKRDLKTCSELRIWCHLILIALYETNLQQLFFMDDHVAGD